MICTPQLSYKKTDYEASFGELFPKRLNAQDKKNTNDKWDAHYYKDNSKTQETVKNKALKGIRLRGDETILDIGCGDGKITAELATLVPQGSVIGIDKSPSMIQLSQNLFPYIENLSFKVADAEAFHFDQKFDYVFGLAVFHWIEDKLSAFKNIKNVLKQNGKIKLTIDISGDCPIQRSFDALQAKGLWKSAIENKEKTFHAPSKREIQDIVNTVGLHDVLVYIKDVEVLFKTFDNLVKWAMGWVPHCTKLDEEEALRFCNDYAKEFYNQQNKDITQPINVSFPILIVEN